jgi:hypothetical protein
MNISPRALSIHVQSDRKEDVARGSTGSNESSISIVDALQRIISLRERMTRSRDLIAGNSPRLVSNTKKGAVEQNSGVIALPGRATGVKSHVTLPRNVLLKRKEYGSAWGATTSGRGRGRERRPKR